VRLKRVSTVSFGNGRANYYCLDILIDRLANDGCTRLASLHQMSFDDAIVSTGDSFHVLQYLFTGM
jgi:hypothetical protein